MKFLFRPVDIASLAFFRFLFGILGFADVTSTLTYKHWYKGWLDPEAFHYKYYGCEWAIVFGDPWMSLFLLSLMAAALGIAVGYRYRLCSIYFAFGFTYSFLLEKAFYLNHGYFLCLLCFLMIFFPAHRNFSVDVFRKPKLYVERIPYWPLFLLQFMMGIVYFYGGIAKVNGDWLQGLPLKIWLLAKSHHHFLGFLLKQEAMAYFMSYGGLLLDLFVVFFLLSARTRVWAFCFVLFFHLTNFLIFEIGVFPWLSIALTSLYFAPDYPRRLFAWLGKKIPRLPWDRWWQNWLNRLAKQGITPAAQTMEHSPQQQAWIRTTIVTFCLIQMLIPLRHHLFPGHVAWTEEGHRYSWRMMLRSKRGFGHYIIKDGVNGQEEKVNPYKILNKKQGYKLFTHPDMILQFAHYLRDEYEAKGFQEVEIYAHIQARLNGREYQKYVDETRDLAQEEWPFFSSKDWIVEMKKDD